MQQPGMTQQPGQVMMGEQPGMHQQQPGGYPPMGQPQQPYAQPPV